MVVQSVQSGTAANEMEKETLIFQVQTFDFQTFDVGLDVVLCPGKQQTHESRLSVFVVAKQTVHGT